MFGSNLKRRGSAVLLVVALMLGLVVAVAAAYDHTQADRLANGIRVDGVEIGGLSTSEAAARLRTRALQIRRRSLYVHAAGKTFVLPAGSVGVTAEVDEAVSKVLATSRRGWFGSRALRDLSGAKIEKSLALQVRYAPGVVPQFVAKVRAATNTPAVDATVKPSARRADRDRRTRRRRTRRCGAQQPDCQRAHPPHAAGADRRERAPRRAEGHA